jgi:flagellar basal body-associated protein FliL
MAKQENTETEQSPAQESELPEATGSKVMPWLVAAMAIVICAGGGFMIGRVFGTRGKAQTVSAAEQTGLPKTMGNETPTTESDSGPTWYYDVEPVVANLNEPGVTRYVRVALTLEVSHSLDEQDGTTFFERKKPLMKHWLTLYLSNQTTENIRGEKNLRHTQAQIAETLNQALFPDTKPHIRRVLFKELSVQ